MNHLQILPDFTVQISHCSIYMGSAVLVKINNIFYVLTAAHVPFGEECEQYKENLSSTLTYESESLGKLIFVKELGNIEIYKTHDIFAIEVTVESYDDFCEVSFTDDIDFPGLNFLFRGRAKSTSGNTYTIEPCKKNGKSKSLINLKIPIDDYNDFKGESGLEILQGFSGSGVFIHDDEPNSAYLSSIVSSVSDDNFNGVNCICISLFQKHLIPSIKLVEYYGGSKVFKLQIAKYKNEITQEMINATKRNDYGVVENLTKKMTVFHDGWENEDLDAFIKDMLLWDNIYDKKIKHNKELNELIEDCKAELACGNNYHHVSTHQQGNDRFQKIREEFSELVKAHTNDTPLYKHARLITMGEIAKLLAICKLKFELKG